MLKIKTSIFFVVLVLLACCAGNRQRKSANQAENGTIAAVDSILQQTIDDFINGCQTPDALKVIVIRIHDSTLYIVPDVYSYDPQEIIHYILHRGIVIRFLFEDNGEKWNFVDTARLKKGLAKKFPRDIPTDDEFDMYAFKYDYQVRSYRIHSKDSLELIFWGFY